MKKLINKVDDVLTESLRGFEAACGDVVRLHRDPVFLSRATPAPAGKVALVSGGGSGHEPLHGGFVGRGMLDAACPGQVFTSPTPDQMLAAAQAVDRLYHAAGGSSIYRSSVLQRCFRDVHVTTQHIMVAQPTYEVVGRVLLGMDPKTPL